MEEGTAEGQLTIEKCKGKSELQSLSLITNNALSILMQRELAGRTHHPYS